MCISPQKFKIRPQIQCATPLHCPALGCAGHGLRSIFFFLFSVGVPVGRHRIHHKDEWESQQKVYVGSVQGPHFRCAPLLKQHKHLYGHQGEEIKLLTFLPGFNAKEGDVILLLMRSWRMASTQNPICSNTVSSQ